MLRRHVIPTPRFVGLALAMATTIASTSAMAAQPLRISVGGGLGVPISRTQRDLYGTEEHLSLGIATPLSTNDVWVYVEATRAASSGQPFTDPTFVPPETKLRWYPIALGVRSNMVPVPLRTQVSLYAGIAALLVPMTIDTPFQKPAHTAVSGVAFEFRPETSIGSAWSAWARYRLLLLTSTNGSGALEVSPSGSALELGISRRFNRGAEVIR